MINKLVSILAVFAFAGVASAAEDGFKVSGDLATSWFTESGKGNNSLAGYPATGAVGSAVASNNEQFSVDMAELNIEKAMGNTNFQISLGFGRIFDQINGAVDPVSGTVKQTLNLTNAFMNHKIGETGLSFKVGKFESFLGYETNNYMDNMNYTRSYSFNYTMPFYFTGVGLNYNFNDMFDVGIVVANASDSTDLDDNRNKTMGIALGAKPMEGLAVKLNYLMGKEGGLTFGVDAFDGSGGGVTAVTPFLAVPTDTSIINGIVSYNLNNMFDFAFQYVGKKFEPAYGPGTEADVSTMTFYAGAKMENYGGGLRYEMVNDDDGALLGTADNKVNVITLTGWYDIDQNARLKAEFSTASADKDIYSKDDPTQVDDSMSTYGVGFMYRF